MKKLAALVFALSACSVQAKTFWSDFSVTYLNGSNYEIGDSSRQVLSFEHVTGTSWGDSFLFFDRLESDNGDVETYGEWSPRIKITDFDKGSFIKNISVAGTIEMGAYVNMDGPFSNGFTNYLLGVGTDLDVPGFNYFQVNVYARSNEFGDNNAQVTLVWAVPIGPLLFDGFLDYATSDGFDPNRFSDNDKAVLGTQMQLKYDIAPHVGLDTKLFVGIEYVIWRNKFDLGAVLEADESNLNFLIKYHF